MEFTDALQLKYVIAALAYSGIGIAVLAASFLVLDLLTPKVSLWKELVEKQNVAFGIFLGALALGISLIISSAIHG
jgi:putative membrane protein